MRTVKETAARADVRRPEAGAEQASNTADQAVVFALYSLRWI
jgi:hypothetical protein